MMWKTLCAFGLTLVTLAGGAQAQEDPWQHRWFWGAQAGLMRFQTCSTTACTWQEALTVGGHWLVTSSRSGLYVAYDHVFFTGNTSALVVDASGSRTSAGASVSTS